MRDKHNPNYGKCEECWTELEASWFIEKEYDTKYNSPTGRTRRAVDCLQCPSCGKKYCVDDTFDGDWC